MSEQVPRGQPTGSLGKLPMIVAVGLIAIFLGFLILLLTMRDDRYWDRLMYLLAGLEAIVFAGAGALFGTTVQRTNVEMANHAAVTARKDAQTQQKRAEEMENDAIAGQMLAAAIQSKAEVSAREAADVGVRPGHVDVTPTDPHLAELAAMASKWFPRPFGSSNGRI